MQTKDACLSRVRHARGRGIEARRHGWFSGLFFRRDKGKVTDLDTTLEGLEKTLDVVAEALLHRVVASDDDSGRANTQG